MLAVILLAVEIALFISIPIYLRARRLEKIRSHIHIRYDSRLDSGSGIVRLADRRCAKQLGIFGFDLSEDRTKRWDHQRLATAPEYAPDTTSRVKVDFRTSRPLRSPA